MKKRVKRGKNNKRQLWKTYEDAVRSIVSQHMDRFGLAGVAPKSGSVEGETGKWRIEVIGYPSDASKGMTVLFEVRRVKRDIARPDAGEFAFRIEDTKSATGYFVTPLGKKLTKGAREIAKKKAIRHVEISSDATPENYILRYLDQMFARVSDSMESTIAGMKDQLRIFVADERGNPVREIAPEDLSGPIKKDKPDES